MTDRNDNPMDLLELALAALREAPVADGPPTHLVASTVEALKAAMIPPDVIRLSERKRKMFRIARYSSTAAAVVLLMIGAAGLFLMDRNASVAFSQVVENVKKAKSVTFVSRIDMPVTGVQTGKWYVQGSAFRMELTSFGEGAQLPPDAPPLLLAVVADVKQKKMLQIEFIGKTAKFLKADDDKVWQAFANPIEQLRKLKEDDAERVGVEELNSHKTDVYRLKKAEIVMGLRPTGGETAKLWVDRKSGLPVRITVERPADSKDKTPLLVFEQFRWNEPLDADLFKLEAPKGFTIVQE